MGWNIKQYWRELTVTLLAVTILILTFTVPLSPLSLTTSTDLLLERRGDVSKYDPSAGAQLTYTSEKAFLENLGIVRIEKILPNFPIINYTSSGLNPIAVVIHNSDSPADLGCNPLYNTFVGVSNSSTHFCIDKDGTVWVFVPWYDGAIAWGNGVVSRPNRSIQWIDDLVNSGGWFNQYTISIELALCGTAPITGCDKIGPEYAENYPAMLQSLSVLVKYIALETGIPLTRDRIVTHRDINSSSRVDPVCCWTSLGGLAGGEAAFSSWVESLTTVDVPTTNIDEIINKILETLLSIEDRLDALESKPSASPAPSDIVCTYTVTANDWDGLSGVAKRELNDSNRWTEIVDLNNLSSPYIVNVGDVLIIPCS